MGDSRCLPFSHFSISSILSQMISINLGGTLSPMISAHRFLDICFPSIDNEHS